jgi:hypothetical protein
MITRNGYTQNEQRLHYAYAAERHDGNRWAIKNHLRKHYDYSEENAWEIYEEFSDFDRNGVPKVVKDPSLSLKPSLDSGNYLVLGLNGVSYTGEEAKRFVQMADALNVSRSSSYRVFVEVQE